MTDDHLKRASDPNQLAKSIIDQVTGQQPSPVDARDPAATAPPDHKDGLEKDLAHATTLASERRGKKTRPA